MERNYSISVETLKALDERYEAKVERDRAIGQHQRREITNEEYDIKLKTLREKDLALYEAQKRDREK